MKKEDTLYLPIMQIYFDQIISGTKKEEFREVKEGITAKRYLQRDEKNSFILDSGCTEQGIKYYIDDFNNGRFPFVPKRYKYLHLAVGYHKERDEAIVEVNDITFIADCIRGNRFCFWVIVYHLGEVVELHRKKVK